MSVYIKNNKWYMYIRGSEPGMEHEIPEVLAKYIIKYMNLTPKAIMTEYTLYQ
jgi:hypothetical protein